MSRRRETEAKRGRRLEQGRKRKQKWQASLSADQLEEKRRKNREHMRKSRALEDEKKEQAVSPRKRERLTRNKARRLAYRKKVVIPRNIADWNRWTKKGGRRNFDWYCNKFGHRINAKALHECNGHLEKDDLSEFKEWLVELTRGTKLWVYKDVLWDTGIERRTSRKKVWVKWERKAKKEDVFHVS